MKVKCRIGQYTPDQHFKQMVTSILPINSKKDETLTRKKTNRWESVSQQTEQISLSVALNSESSTVSLTSP